MPLQVGDLVYARVTAADRDLEPVLACTDAQGKVSSSVSLDIAQFLTGLLPSKSLFLVWQSGTILCIQCTVSSILPTDSLLCYTSMHKCNGTAKQVSVFGA